MDVVRLNLPYAFLRTHGRLSWRSVHFGFQNELIGPDVPKELAIDQIAESETLLPALLDLASGSKNDPVSELVKQLAASELECPEEKLREEWLYLVLAWIYEHRDDYMDPLQKVEEVYADFGYPQRIAGFVRYMPMEGPDLGSREANENRLFERWRKYLDEAGRCT
jgi:hypothetical protein